MIEAGKKLIKNSDDDIVISGIAGNFPDADGMEELANSLYNKAEMISDDERRWKLDHPEIPQRTGKLKEVEKFDASAFGVHFNQAESMDPMNRILLEKSYEAIIDSGFKLTETLVDADGPNCLYQYLPLAWVNRH
ncbi:unnamed protein product [Nezara viridula]|uniref:Beta-ketoacyl synthase-like N-terminal domain-containing protein n=1 Tax=Nezara viridula TaxID=85310 RepID=A0A9P0H3F6_NEZVI|nr:unnamed protein product [Nezara viridula]